jgi:hypothetical protein
MGRGRKILIFIAIAYISVGFYAGTVFGQVQDSSASSTATQAQLQAQLQQIEAQITQYQGQLAQTQAQKNTLANKIKSLQKQQAILQDQVQATNLQVTQLGQQITVTQNSITQNTSKVADLQSQIAGVLQAINQNDQYPFLYTVVSQQKLSDVFSAYEDYAQISQGLSGLVDQLNQTNTQLGQEQQQYSDQQTADQNLLAIKALQQSQLASSVNDQNTLLQQTKGKEADYQIVISDSQKQAAAIRSRIYQLLGISSQITFGQALQIAQLTSQATGVDPAFLLAILTQESNLGNNVGTCNRAGDPPSKSYKVVMKPTRDIQPFLAITASLGLDPDVTPVSCPLHDKNGNQEGWGGAMGPAQFIPSTWVGYESKITSITGDNPPNPWDIHDAFTAAGVKLASGGANGTYQGDWDAAMRYFSGGLNPAYSFYGDNVMVLTAKYQADINSLGK